MNVNIDAQSAEFSENIVEKGVHKIVCFVVKKTPLQFTLSVSPDSKITFANADLIAELVYDRPEAGPVSLVGHEVFEYRARIDDGGRRCIVSARIFILTTQVSGTRFVVKFTLTPPGAPGVVVKSNPIVCVSKQQQIRNHIKRAEPVDDSARPKKRARTEDVYEALDEIKESQQETKALLLAQLEQLQGRFSAPGPLPAPSRAPAVPRETTMEQALAAMVAAYQREVRSGSAVAAAIRLSTAINSMGKRAVDDVHALGFHFLVASDGRRHPSDNAA